MGRMLAWLFPGQGSQSVGMGRALAEASPAARQVFQDVDQALGESLTGLIFDGPLEALTLTENTQPAIVAMSSAVVAALRERFGDSIEPAFAAGHSLGEWSALVAGGVLSPADATRLCRVRGRAMQGAVGPGIGAMAAVMGLTPETVQTICEQASSQEHVVEPANFNGPGQTVIAGHAVAVDRAAAAIAQQGGKSVMLKVSAPFHCSLMAPAAKALASALEGVQLAPARFPIVANVSAKPVANDEEVRDGLTRQVDHPVQWTRTIEFLAEQGVTHALELGPGKVLAGLGKRIDRSIKVHSVAEPSDLDGIAKFLETP